MPGISDSIVKPVITGEDLVLNLGPDEAKRKQLKEDWQAYLNDKQSVANSVLKMQASTYDVSAWAPPFISADRSADYFSQEAYRQLVGKVQEAKKLNDQEIYNARMDVERYQNTIAECQKRIEEAQTKVNNPNYALQDQRYAASDVKRYQKLLDDAQDRLQYSKNRLDELQASSK